MEAVHPATDHGFVRVAGSYTNVRERELVALLADHARLTARVAELEQQVERYRAALEAVTKREGAFSRDSLTHAQNVIDNMAEVARTALKE